MKYPSPLGNVGCTWSGRQGGGPFGGYPKNMPKGDTAARAPRPPFVNRRTNGVTLRFAVFIRDEESTEEFDGLARIDTEAEDEDTACERAITLHAEFCERPFDRGDVALCARLAPSRDRMRVH